MRLRKNPDDILYSSTSFLEIEIVVLTCRDPNARTWFFKIFSFSWLVMNRRNDIFCVTDISFFPPKICVCKKRLNTKKVLCLKWMNNSNKDNFCDKLQQKVIKITLYDKMNYTRIWLVLTYDVTINNIPLFCHIKQIDFMVPWIFTVIDHRRGQNLIGTSVTHSAAPRMPLFCSSHILMSSAIYYWTKGVSF